MNRRKRYDLIGRCSKRQPKLERHPHATCCDPTQHNPEIESSDVTTLYKNIFSTQSHHQHVSIRGPSESLLHLPRSLHLPCQYRDCGESHDFTGPSNLNIEGGDSGEVTRVEI